MRREILVLLPLILFNTCAPTSISCRDGCSPPTYCDTASQLCVRPDAHGQGDSGQQNTDDGGIDAGVVLTIEPEPGNSSNFGTISIGDTALRTFVVTHRGTSQSGNMNVRITGNDSEMFNRVATEGDCGASLDSGMRCYIRVSCSPTVTGDLNAALVVDSAVGSVALHLTSIGINPPHLAIGGATFDFGNVAVGQTATITLVLSNSGGTSTSTTQIVSGNTDFQILGGLDTDCGASLLEPAHSCDIRVQFTPSGGVSRASIRATGTTGEMATEAIQGNGQFVLSVFVVGSGTITQSGVFTCANDCTHDFDKDSTVVLNATPKNGFSLSAWEGPGCTGSATTCTVKMSEARTVTATFVPARYNVNFTYQGTGGGSIHLEPPGTTCGTNCFTYQHGTSVVLSSLPISGSYFSRTTSCGNSNPCMQTIEGPTSIEVWFEQEPSLKYSFDGDGINSGSIPGHNATLKPDADFMPGKFGSAVSSAAPTFAQTTGMRAELGNYTRVTIGVWLNLSSAATPTGPYGTTILDNGNRNTAPYGGVLFSLYNASSTLLCVSSTTNPALPQGSCWLFPLPPSFARGWHHYIIQYAGAGVSNGEGGSVRMFYDNVEQGVVLNDSSNNPVFTAAIPDVMTLGGAGVQMDDLRIYNRTFTAAEQCSAVVSGVWTGTSCILP